MADISYEPIFTYKGLNKISKALQSNSTIELTHLALGDAKDHLAYNATPDAEFLRNEIIRIEISTIKFTDITESNGVLMHIEGTLSPQNSPNMVIREYGIYDNEGDLIIVCRYPDYHTMETGMPMTNMIFKSDIYLTNNAAAFTEDFYSSGEGATIEEFTAHTNNYDNPHNLSSKNIPGLENIDNTLPSEKPLNQDTQDLFRDGKFAIGFVNREESKITNTSDTIRLEENTTKLLSMSHAATGSKFEKLILAPNGKIYCIPYSATRVLEIDPVTKQETLIGNTYTIVNKFKHAVLASDGKIYCSPFSNSNVIRIDPSNATTTIVGSTFSGAEKWMEIIEAPNGMLYCTPYDHAQVLKIDPVLATTTLIGDLYTGADKWLNAILAPNGKIYCIPLRYGQIMEIDPTTDTTRLVGPMVSTNATYNKAILAPNGKIYLIPYVATQVLEFNPDTGTHQYLAGTFYSGKIYKYQDAVLTPDGKIYCIPHYGATQVLEIDTNTGATSLIGDEYYTDNVYKWKNGILASDGNIYCPPFTAGTKVLKIDPKTRTTKLIGDDYVGTAKWSGAVQAPNGKIYSAPYNTTQTLEITEELSRYIYKYGLKYEIKNNLSLTINPDSYGYIGYNTEDNILYYIGEHPNFDTDVLVAWYYSNSTDGIIWLNDERHSVTRNVEYHKLTHNEVGTIWRYGGALTTTDFTNLNITDLGVADEDLEFDIKNADPITNPFEQILINARLPVLYVSNGRYRRLFNNDVLNWLYNANGAVYNDLNSGALLDVADNNYLSYVVLFTTSIKEPVKLIVGTGQYTTESDAENESFESYGLPMPELIAAYRIILHKSEAYSNLAKTKITKINTIRSLNDGGKADITNHSLLTDRFTGIQHPTSAIIGLDEAIESAGSVSNIELIGTMNSDIYINETSKSAILTTYQSDSRNMPGLYGGGSPNGDSRELIGTVGASKTGGTGGGMWMAAALSKNGHIYCPPYETTQVLKINPETKKDVLIGSSISGNRKYTSIAMGPNGKMYCPPYDSTSILVIDPSNDTTSLMGGFGSGAAKWIDAALSKNGMIYCAPFNSSRVLELNTYDPLLSVYIGDTFEENAALYGGIARSPYGKLYCAPFNATRILEIDPIAKTTIPVGPDLGTGLGKWRGIALAPNGLMYCAPYNGSNRVLEFDPIAKTAVLIGESYEGEDKWVGITLGANGKLYCAPRGIGKTLEIDPVKKITKLLKDPAGYHSGIVLAQDGNLYLPPQSTGYIKELNIFPKTVDYQNFLKLNLKIYEEYPPLNGSTVTFAFTESITATVSTGILLSDYVDPVNANEFIIQVNEGVVLQGKQGNAGSNGGIYFPNGWGNPTRYYDSRSFGGTGGVGGYGLNLAGFEGKKITFILNGTLRGGTGGRGGNGAYEPRNLADNGYWYTYGGAGGNGGPTLYNSGNVTVETVNGNLEPGLKGPNGSNGGYSVYDDGSSSCFIKGQLVLMADGTYLPIEDIRVGDKVQGAYGPNDINTVVYLQRPPRGNRIIYDICNLLVSDEHGILNGDRDGFLFLDMENHYAEQNMYQACLDKDFNEVEVWFAGPQDGVTKKEDLVIGSTIASSTGFKVVEDIIPTDIKDEMLYHLVLDGGSRTYCISDVFVSGYTDDKLFDYKKGELRQ